MAAHPHFVLTLTTVTGTAPTHLDVLEAEALTDVPGRMPQSHRRPQVNALRLNEPHAMDRPERT